MNLTSLLKELIKKISTVPNQEPEKQQAVLDDIDTFISKLSSIIKKHISNVKSIGGSHTSPKDQTPGLEKSIVDKANLDLFNLFPSPEIPSSFLLEAVRKLAPIIGTQRFLNIWWPKLVKRWLSRPLVGDGKKIIRLVVDFCCLVEEFPSPKTTNPNLNHAFSYFLEYFIVNNRELNLTSDSFVFIPNEPKIASNNDPTSPRELLDNLKLIITQYGAARPYGFFLTCGFLFEKASYRISISELILDFTSDKPDYSHKLEDTFFLERLLYSLLSDNSWDLFILNVTILSMSLPYLLQNLTTILPFLYLVLGRFWSSNGAELYSLNLKQEDGPERFLSFENLSDESSSKSFKAISGLFSLSYGLFPNNTINIIKSPIQYLENVLYDNESHLADLFKSLSFPNCMDEKKFKHNAQKLISEHTFHTSLLFTDSQTELSPEAEWRSFEPEDVVSRCLSLRKESEYSASTCEKKKSYDPILPKTDDRTNSYLKELTDIFNKILLIENNIKFGDQVLRNVSDLNLEGTTIPLEDLENNKFKNDLFSSYLLLRCELIFESYLRKQQAQYIRRLHRDRVVESSSEAERHSLYSTCRSLRNEVKVLKDLLERQRNESSASQSKHVKWENELNQKLKSYRDLSRDLKQQNSIFTSEIDAMKEKHNKDNLILQSTRSSLQSMESQLESLNDLTSEIQQKNEMIENLSSKIIQWELNNKKVNESESDIILKKSESSFNTD